MAKITKDTKKTAIRIVKNHVDNRKVRKKLIRLIKDLSYDQDEQRLANMLLNNNQAKVFTRLFEVKGREFLENWLTADYLEIVESSKLSANILMEIENKKGFVLDADDMLFEKVRDFVTDSQVHLTNQKHDYHQHILEEYKTELAVMRKEYENQIDKIEAELEKIEGKNIKIHK